MKNLKFGFSLAELLIAIAIMAVVSVMSLQIAKHGMDHAGNMYFYNAYKGLDLAIRDANHSGIKMNDSEAIDSNANKAFFNKLADTLVVDNSKMVYNGNTFTMTAKNGVSYEFNGISSSSHTCSVTIITPMRSQNNRAYCMYVIDDEMLVPAETANNLINNGYIDLLNRRDLLPAYLANGVRGKVRYFADTNTLAPYVPNTYTSYKQAYCTAKGSLVKGPMTVIDCAGINMDPNEARSMIKVANPQKVL